MTIKSLEQEPKIKVLDRDEVMRRLGTVDIYQASAWATLLKDLEYLKLKICEVEIMTREEVIEELEWDEHIETNPKKKEAYSVAIKSIKKLHYIENAVIIWELDGRKDSDHRMWDIKHVLEEGVEGTAEWIGIENEEMKTVGFYCSNCDLPMETEDRTDYCPNCGRKMVK